jgi:hypothetical protein
MGANITFHSNKSRYEVEYTNTAGNRVKVITHTILSDLTNGVNKNEFVFRDADGGRYTLAGQDLLRWNNSKNRVRRVGRDATIRKLRPPSFAAVLAQARKVRGLKVNVYKNSVTLQSPDSPTVFSWMGRTKGALKGTVWYGADHYNQLSGTKGEAALFALRLAAQKLNEFNRVW